MDLIERNLDFDHIGYLLKIFPVVAILGKRQSGKTTIARELLTRSSASLIFFLSSVTW